MEKDAKLSAIRFVALLMIIFCHILQGLGNELAFWINIGVQVFFFLSGYLYGKKNIKDFKKFYKRKGYLKY